MGIMKKERIGKQLGKMTEGLDQELLHKICGSVVEDHRRGELGYCPRINLDAIDREDNRENELRNKIESWVHGFIGLRSKDKIAYMEKMVQAPQENIANR